MRGRFVLLVVALLLAEGAAMAQCRPGYVGSGYYRSSDCREYLIPKAYPFGGDILSPFAGPVFVPGPFSYGYSYGLPAQMPGSYFGPGYYQSPQPYFRRGARSPSARLRGRAQPPRTYQAPSWQGGLQRPMGGRRPRHDGRIVRMGNGVWTNE